MNLLLNILIPVMILMKLSSPERLGPALGLVVALAFPIGYGIYDFIKQKKLNVFSVIGLISILLTGVIGLFQLDPSWVAVKEAAVPLVLGMAVVISLWTPFPLVKKLIYNDQLINVERIDQILEERDSKPVFEKKLVLATYLVAASFLVSAVLNYVLAKVLVKSPAGTEAFNEELGQMTFWSFPVIAVPSTLIMFLALWMLIKSIQKLTSLELNDILNVKE